MLCFVSRGVFVYSNLMFDKIDGLEFSRSHSIPFKISDM